MPPEKRDFGSLEINGSTYELASDLQGRGFPTFIDPEYVSDWEAMNIKPVLSPNAEMEFKGYANAPLFEQMCGIDLALGDDRVGKVTLHLESPYLVQVRKHRKKRINKKWAKRYGFKYMFKVLKMEDVEIENHDGEIDILGRTERRIVR